MAVLNSTDLILPHTLVPGMWQRASQGSTLATLSPNEPEEFGDIEFATFTKRPKFQIVGESEAKAQTDVAFGSIKSQRIKAQVTIRMSEEVRWYDEDKMLGVYQTIANSIGDAGSRLIDVSIYHGIDPLSGAVSPKITKYITKDGTSIAYQAPAASVTNPVERAARYQDALDAAYASVLSVGATPTGIALDPRFAFALSRLRDNTGRKLYPELGLGTNVGSWEGIATSASSTVSAQEELGGGGNSVRAIVGDFRDLHWGYQRQVPIEVILYGDPDNTGRDLKGHNEIALRAEVAYYVAVMDSNSFAVLNETAA